MREFKSVNKSTYLRVRALECGRVSVCRDACERESYRHTHITASLLHCRVFERKIISQARSIEKLSNLRLKVFEACNRATINEAH